MVFVKADFLLVPYELVAKMLAGLVDMHLAGEVTVSREILMIECIQFFWILSVVEVSRIGALIEDDVCIVIPALDFYTMLLSQHHCFDLCTMCCADRYHGACPWVLVGPVRGIMPGMVF